MLLPEGFIENTAIVHLNTLPKSAHGIYLTVCLAVMISLVTMPFVYTDIGTKAYGIVRPAMERTSIKPAVSGIIDSVFFNEGQTIPAGAVLLRIKDMESNAKKRANRLESRQYEQFIHDLRLLTSHKEINDEVFSLLQSPLYREQVNRFFHRRAEHELI
jgi:multidrug efflux pump subunit AcrA (membrane-fusion protein)